MLDTIHGTDFIAEQASKTLLGQLDSIDDIITGLRYVRSVRSDKGGSRLEKSADEIFASFDGIGPRCWVGKNMDHALVGTPRVRLPLFRGERRTGSLKIANWGRHNVALVIATDPSFIADRWLAIVPLDTVRALKVEVPA